MVELFNPPKDNVRFRNAVSNILDELDIPSEGYPGWLEEMWPEVQSKLARKMLSKNFSLWGAIYPEEVFPAYVNGLKKTGSLSSVKPSRNLIKEKSMEYFEDRGLELCKSLTETDLTRLKDVMRDNWGKGEKAFAKAYQDDFGVSRDRLELIYRTEHHRAQNKGVEDFGKELNHEYKLWFVPEDERTCPICRSHLNDVVPIDGVFVGEDSKGNPAEYGVPQDSHPNCRCTMVTLRAKDLTEDNIKRLNDNGYQLDDDIKQEEE